MMNNFKFLPVLDDLLHSYKSEDVKELKLICVQHLLSSTGSLFEAIIRLGVNPSNIYLLGKIYSTHPDTEQKLAELGINVIKASQPAIPGTYRETLEADVKRLWQAAVSNMGNTSIVIILDDGGYAIKDFPEEQLQNQKVIGIEQTMSGIKLLNRNFRNLPVISVAGSAAKTIIEPPIVSEAVSIRLGKVIKKLHPRMIGIIGYGNIGFAVAKDLSKEYQVEVYEKKENFLYKQLNGVKYSNDLHSVFQSCDLIVGATGEDISKECFKHWLAHVNEDKTLISISSGDIEFKSLLRNAREQMSPVSSALQTLEITTRNGKKIKILRGGMVANFTGEADSSPAHIIQVTRGMLLAAIMQVLTNLDEIVRHKEIMMLEPTLQRQVVTTWFKDQPQRKADYSEEILKSFDDEIWIAQNSEGLWVSRS
jgi:hypothetical protein